MLKLTKLEKSFLTPIDRDACPTCPEVPEVPAPSAARVAQDEPEAEPEVVAPTGKQSKTK